jgi:hypothetical protein
MNMNFTVRNLLNCIVRLLLILIFLSTALTIHAGCTKNLYVRLFTLRIAIFICTFQPFLWFMSSSRCTVNDSTVVKLCRLSSFTCWSMMRQGERPFSRHIRSKKDCRLLANLICFCIGWFALMINPALSVFLMPRFTPIEFRLNVDYSKI